MPTRQRRERERKAQPWLKARPEMAQKKAVANFLDENMRIEVPSKLGLLRGIDEKEEDPRVPPVPPSIMMRLDQIEKHVASMSRGQGAAGSLLNQQCIATAPPAPPSVLSRLDIGEKEFREFRNETLDRFNILAERIGRLENVLGL